MLVPDDGRVRRLRLPRPFLIVLPVCLLALLAFGLWGAWNAHQAARLARTAASLEARLAAVQERDRLEIRRLHRRIAAQQQKLAVYARNIGRMQARLARLDALGSRLVETAALDPSKFNFHLQPAFGGPRLSAAEGIEGIRLDAAMRELDDRLETIDAQLAAIDYVLRRRRDARTARPHGWPTEGGWISSRYGLRTDPFTGEPAVHRGVDIANRFAAPVLATSRGVVVFAGKTRDFGNMIEIVHGYGYRTRYGHLATLNVRVGDLVEDNQLIGRIGSSGRSTGPHLHYEVHRYGKHLDPMKFLPRG